MKLQADPPPAAEAATSSLRAAGFGPGISVTARDGVPVITLAGVADRDLASRADPLIQLTTLEHSGPLVLDVSAVDEVTGALLGLLLRASRRLAWRNRQLIIVCRAPDSLRRLEIAGLDALATLVESA